MDAINETAPPEGIPVPSLHPIDAQVQDAEQRCKEFEMGLVSRNEAKKPRGYATDTMVGEVADAIATIQRLAPSFIIAVEMGPNTFVDMKGSANDHNMLLSFIGIKGLRFYKKEDIKI